MKSLGHMVLTRSTPSTNNFLLIRILAAILVMVGHAFALAPAPCESCHDPIRLWTGYVSSHILGVQIFFIISGFLVFGSYQKNPNLRGFLWARALRIIPGFIVCLLLMAGVIGPIFSQLTPEDYFLNSEVRHYFFQSAFFLNYVDHLPETFFSVGSRGGSINGSLWTIPLEVRLYLIVGFLGGLGAFLSSRRANFSLGLLLIALFLGLKWGDSSEGTISTIQLTFFFWMGAFWFNNRQRVDHDGRILLCLLGGITLLRHQVYFPYAVALILPYSVLWFAYTKKIPLPAWLQDYSYGIYLYGFPIQQMLAHAFSDMGPYAMMAFSIPLALIAGALSWHLVEKRFLALKSGLIRPPSFSLS